MTSSLEYKCAFIDGSIFRADVLADSCETTETYEKCDADGSACEDVTRVAHDVFAVDDHFACEGQSFGVSFL